MILSHTLLQYGDVFTFTLLGRKVTVALGAKGNNFVLGGKSTAFSAEDAYTVCAIV
jgi:sterol 14-demethylase